MSRFATASHRITVHEGAAALDTLDDDWSALARHAPTPFLMPAWLRSWWSGYGHGEPLTVLARDTAGDVRGGALLMRSGRRLLAAANVHSGDWDVVAADRHARAALWKAIPRLGAARIRLRGLGERSSSAPLALSHLVDAGFYAMVQTDLASPFLPLPGSFDELIARRSGNLRQQWRRRSRALQRAGRSALRVRTDGPGLERDVEAFIRLEARSWKGREGTAIASDPRSDLLYRSFAREAAEAGMLRIYVLELDGTPVAMDLGCRVGDVGFLVKTAFDESLARLSPGLVLRGEVLRASIEEGMKGYDFLGGPDPYKLRWTDETRARCLLDARSGLGGRVASGYQRVRPTLVRVHRRLNRSRPTG